MSTIAARFRAAAEAHRNRPAIVASGRVTTYGELLEQSLRVAGGLAARGVGRGDRVGVCMEKGAEAVAVLLGSMLAGAACVPVEASMPPLRLAAIARNAEVAALFLGYSPRLPLASLRGIPGMRAIVFHGGQPPDRDANREWTWDDIQTAPLEEGAHGPTTEADPAYILFTSGSSGTPKGVVLSHGAALAFVDWATNVVGLTGDDHVASHAAVGFDLTVFDLYATLLSGATLYPVPEMQRGMAPFLVGFIETNAITVWYSVPSIAARIAEVCSKQDRVLASVRHLIVAGEVFPTRALTPLRRAFSQARIHNWYGPTETNVVTFHEVTPADDGARPMPIGRACPFATVRLLDGDLREPPVGEKGVLYAGGGSLMSGYWGDAEKTRLSMLEIDGKTYYRTGDVATVDAGGVHHYIGRADDMVKVQGYRVEPAEVECALRDVVGTEEAAVVAAEKEGETALVGFVAGVTLTDAMRQELRRRLPGYMIPRDIVFVNVLPRNDRGKVDRAELTRMASSR